MKLIIFFLSLFLLLLPTFLSASDKYIKVVKVLDDNQLLLVRSVLNEIGFTSTFTQTKTNFIVFVGPFKEEGYADDALQRIKQHFAHAYIFEKETKKIEKKIKKEVQDKEIVNQDQNKTLVKVIDSDISTFLTSETFFINISLGANLSTAKNISKSGTIDVNLPSKYMFSYSLEGGYSFDNGIFFSLGVLRSLDNDVVFTNAYATANYRFDPINDFAPFIGLVGGVSMLTWNTSPISDIVSSKSNSFSTLYGSQIGLIYVNCSNINLFASYQYLILEHTSDVSILTSSSEIQHNSMHNLNVGLGFNFSI